jgi:hypothetical protein
MCSCTTRLQSVGNCSNAWHLLLRCFVHRYVPTGPGGATLLNKPAPAERRFEGIRLESPGPNLPSGPLQHLQICSECYNTEAARMGAGQKSRLPGGLMLTDLVPTVGLSS